MDENCCYCIVNCAIPYKFKDISEHFIKEAKQKTQDQPYWSDAARGAAQMFMMGGVK
jgi:hypothetical protein